MKWVGHAVSMVRGEERKGI